MDLSSISLKILDIVYVAGKISIYSIIAFTIIRSSIISAVKELKNKDIL